MAVRDINSRYHGTLFGLLWSSATPIVLLAAYWLVIGRLLKASWPGVDDRQYPFVLFSGIIVHIFFSDILNRSGSLIENHRAYVTKVVFPLGILPAMTVLTSIFHFSISLCILFAGQLMFGLGLPPTLFFLPIIVFTMALMALGLSWLLSAMGVYLKDLQQVVPLLMTVSMFASPIFFPLDGLDSSIRIIFMANPVSIPVEALRDAAIFGRMPNLHALGTYAAVACAALFIGSWWFRFMRRGFADVL